MTPCQRSYSPPVNELGEPFARALQSRPGPHGRRPARRPERQQILLRRGLALGAGLLVLILIVLGVKGCLDARKNRALTDYARNVTQIVDETQQTSKAFFGKLADPGNLSVTEFVTEVNADRSAMDNYPARVDGLNAPGDMGHAQNALELVYELRASAMTRNRRQDEHRAGRRRRRRRRRRDRQADAEAAGRSDVLYAAVVRPEIDGVLADNGIEGDDVPKSAFLPDGTMARRKRGQLGARLGQRLQRRARRPASTGSA